MIILIAIIVLSGLIFVHELGHFLAAKKVGVNVKEFGFGYPPRAVVLGRRWGTLWTLNWIPFGGFVKILGENYEEAPEESSSSKSPRVSSLRSARLSSEDFPQGQKRFTNISKKWQAAILAAGVFFNFLFAWLLLSLGFMIGVPASVNNDFGAPAKDPALTILEVLPESPAARVGLKSGDKILNFDRPEAVSDFINRSLGSINLDIDRGGEKLRFEVIPSNDISNGNKVIGIYMDMVGVVTLPFHKAIWQGGRTTVWLTGLTVEGLAGLAKDAVVGRADVSNIAGPVGIVGLVGDASRLGLAYLMTFTALISINLVIINLLPVPALDGGRLVLVGIEAVFRKRVNPKVVGVINSASFALLILLMALVTYRDILNLF